MTRHTETIEVITRDQRRRRWSAAEKAALVRKTYEPGMSVSLVARQEGVSASLLFVTSRMIIWPLVEQIRLFLVPLFHGLHRRLAAQC